MEPAGGAEPSAPPRQFSEQILARDAHSSQNRLTEMAALSWGALPDELLSAIARLLLGVDLLRLARVDRRSRRVLSRSEHYASRLSHVHYQRADEPQVIPSDSQQIYMQANSLRFGGQSESQQLPQSFSPVFWSTDTLFGLLDRDDSNAPSFTLDAWFSLSPLEPDIIPGGVLLGLQNEKCRESGGQWPDFYCQLLHVDTERNLYCSVTADKPCVVAHLQIGRWYHVALVFQAQSQDVYVDGELVDVQRDQEQQLESFPYYYAQVGAGFVSGDSVGKPAADYSGWYGFHGVIDDLRIWHEALTPEKVAALSRDCAELERSPTFSLKRDVPAWMAHGVEKVRCSRPSERWCVVVAACERADREAWV